MRAATFALLVALGEAQDQRDRSVYVATEHMPVANSGSMMQVQSEQVGELAGKLSVPERGVVTGLMSEFAVHNTAVVKLDQQFRATSKDLKTLLAQNAELQKTNAITKRKLNDNALQLQAKDAVLRDLNIKIQSEGLKVQESRTQVDRRQGEKFRLARMIDDVQEHVKAKQKMIEVAKAETDAKVASETASYHEWIKQTLFFEKASEDAATKLRSQFNRSDALLLATRQRQPSLEKTVASEVKQLKKLQVPMAQVTARLNATTLANVKAEAEEKKVEKKLAGVKNQWDLLQKQLNN